MREKNLSVEEIINTNDKDTPVGKLYIGYGEIKNKLYNITKDKDFLFLLLKINITFKHYFNKHF